MFGLPVLGMNFAHSLDYKMKMKILSSLWTSTLFLKHSLNVVLR